MIEPYKLAAPDVLQYKHAHDKDIAKCKISDIRFLEVTRMSESSGYIQILS